MRTLTLIAFVATSISVPVFAQGGSQDATQQICRSMPTTGTRVIRERICLSREQWARLRDEAQRKHAENNDFSTSIHCATETCREGVIAPGATPLEPN